MSSHEAAAGIGTALGLVWILPFAGLLMSIAVAPLLAPRLWHHHYGKIASVWALAFLMPFILAQGIAAALHEVVRTALVEYLPFVALLGALYTVAGGVRLTGTLRGTPGVNTLILLAGTLVASITGTTGAAMLLVRPLVRANRRRRHVSHVFVFFIILVANIGGALSPLGDPPLFLGFLEGVPFFWPTRHLAVPMGFAASVLLALFYVIDSHYHRRASGGDPSPLAEVEKIGIEGKANLALLLAVLAIVMLGGLWHLGVAFTVLGVALEGQQLLTMLLLLAVSVLSLRLTRPAIRRANEFGWAPMIEVAILFAAIFVTIVPALAILRAGPEGSAAGLGQLLNPGGVPDERTYFWATGVLSAFLDNAPTYLLLFNLAGGEAALLAGPLATTLVAISAGAVFFGALTYIGNAPNFMVKAIVEAGGIRMPSFLAYMVWSGSVLLPLFAVMTWLFL